MIASSFAYRLALTVAAFITLVEGPRLHAQNAGLPESMRLALIRYADLDPLAVTWTQTVEATPIGRETIVVDVPDKIISDGPIVQQLAFHDGRIYVRREIQGSSSWPPRTDEFAFDRNVFFTAKNLFYAGNLGNNEPKDQPYLHKWLPKNDRPEASYFSDDYFRAAGVRLPARTKELVRPWHPQSELLALLAEGGRVEAIDRTYLEGRPLIRVQVVACNIEEKSTSPRRYDFYCDPERAYAVRRLETRDEAGRPLTRSDCMRFEQVNGQPLWLPRLCRVEEHNFAGVPNTEKMGIDVSTPFLYVKKIQVNALDTTPWPDDRFRLKYTTPGVYVNDASFPEMKGKDGVFYQMPANPHRLVEVIAARRALYQGWTNAEKRSRPLRVLFLVLNGVGLASLAGYFFMRRRKRASST